MRSIAVRVPTVVAALTVLVLTGAAKCEGEGSGRTTFLENGTRTSTVQVLACRQIGTEASAKTLVTNKEGGKETFHIQMTYESLAGGLRYSQDRNVLVGKDSTNYLGFGYVFDQRYDDLKCVVTRFYAIHG